MKINLSKPHKALRFPSGKEMKNRFMLAPLTNKQSHADGKLSDNEFNWLAMRARGQFGLIMTCASHVQAKGKTWEGQLGIFSDAQISGHQRLTNEIQNNGGLAVVQLFHGGMRAAREFIDEQPVSPSDNEEYESRALSLTEVHEIRDDFIDAAQRAKKAGYDGVEVHGAFGYLVAQFLSIEFNQRNDAYGGTLKNRSRLLFEIVEGIREACGDQFLVGVRLCPERYGMVLSEIKQLAKWLIASDKIDFLDLALWDVFKIPEEKTETEKKLLEHFLELDYKNVKLTVSGNIRGGKEVLQVLKSGVDFVTIGKSAILHHDFPIKVIENEYFIPSETPVSVNYLKNQGLSSNFIEMMKSWPEFVKD
ncbi:MAG: NADH:flavin oxidoreductase [Maribacter sp.]|uniref:NADH:flavin oxidoreductase n=1 Tax=Maribacter sp. TaxID=1897614 RepID=UPI003297599D